MDGKQRHNPRNTKTTFTIHEAYETGESGHQQRAATGWPLERKAAKERAQIVEEMELQARTPPSPVLSGAQLDVAVPELDDDQIHAIFGDGPPITPQTAEGVL
ncbi:hypothetical protein NDU88_003597 [Pleurodeles waltl]|uniref:Uncharacterized protein n=1 Tax=Pleurodeles waltl TaxID=8319 RepID=A0AAV7T5E5_PLEWA|nr:hypothetical protein NDU88_003597 [Pleurodeles waltl]